MENVKRPLILFSSGLDSTYLLWTQLQKGNVDVLYVSAGQHPSKVSAERSACTKIIEMLEEMTGNRVVNQKYIKVSDGIRHDSYWKFSQPASWMYAALHHVDYRAHSSVMIGYVLGDQILQCLGHLHAAWDSLYAISQHGVVPLEFPLLEVTKQHILSQLPNNVAKQIWVCELPETVEGRHYHCGNCIPCMTMFSAIAMDQYSKGTEYSKEVGIEDAALTTDAYLLFDNFKHKLNPKGNPDVESIEPASEGAETPLRS